MRLIAHRGNLNGPSTDENRPEYLLEAIKEGFDVEADIWCVGFDWYLGHDEPTYPIGLATLPCDRVIYHAKNADALFGLWTLVAASKIDGKGGPIHVFSQESDPYSLTNRGYFWTNIGQPIISEKCIQVMPEYSGWNINTVAHSVCTDYPLRVMSGLQ